MNIINLIIHMQIKYGIAHLLENIFCNIFYYSYYSYYFSHANIQNLYKITTPTHKHIQFFEMVPGPHTYNLPVIIYIINIKIIGRLKKGKNVKNLL